MCILWHFYGDLKWYSKYASVETQVMRLVSAECGTAALLHYESAESAVNVWDEGHCINLCRVMSQNGHQESVWEKWSILYICIWQIMGWGCYSKLNPQSLFAFSLYCLYLSAFQNTPTVIWRNKKKSKVSLDKEIIYFWAFKPKITWTINAT